MPQLNYLDKNIYFYSLLKILFKVKPNNFLGVNQSINQSINQSNSREQ